jgi:hypothetical protein
MADWILLRRAGPARGFGWDIEKASAQGRAAACGVVSALRRVAHAKFADPLAHKIKRIVCKSQINNPMESQK